MHARWEHFYDLKGPCPVCGKPAHVGASMRTGRLFWLEDEYDVRGHHRSHSVHGLAEVEWEEFKRLADEAREKGIEPRATVGGGKAVSRRVRCVETGVEYQSIQAAADTAKRSRTSLSCAIKRGGTCAGYHWELVG